MASERTALEQNCRNTKPSSLWPGDAAHFQAQFFSCELLFQDKKFEGKQRLGEIKFTIDEGLSHKYAEIISYSVPSLSDSVDVDEILFLILNNQCHLLWVSKLYGYTIFVVVHQA